MNNKKTKMNRGFTLVEAIVAILILSISVSAMISVTANSISSARYSNGTITVNYLLQEAIDSIRNSRDTIVFQLNNGSSGGWSNFKSKYNSCFSADGCTLKMESFDPSGNGSSDVIACTSSGCPVLYYDSNATSLFYNLSNQGVATTYQRIVKMQDLTTTSGATPIKVTVTINWKTGNLTRTQSLDTILFNWQQ